MNRLLLLLTRARVPLRSRVARLRSRVARRHVTAMLAGAAMLLAALVTTGSPAVAADGCTLNASPSSFSSAVAAAVPGQTVCLATGDYGTWQGTDKAIVVQAASGATPTMQINFGSGASGFTLSGMRGMSGSIGSGATNVTVQNSTFSSELDLEGATSNVVLNQNDFSFPVQSTLSGPDAKIYVQTSGGSPGSAATIENNVIANGDLDGVHVAGGSGLLIRGNEFLNLCDRGVNHTDNIQFEGGTRITVAANYVYEPQSCPTQGITSYDGQTNGLVIEDNVVDVPRDWGIELYSDTNSIVVHNTVVWHPISYSEFNTPTGQIDIDRKPQDPAGTGTQVYDNIADVDFTNGSSGTAHNNVSGQRAIYVGPTNTWAGFKLAPNSPVGLHAASDGLDDGARITVPAPQSPTPGHSSPTSPGKGGSSTGKKGSKGAARALKVTSFSFAPSDFFAMRAKAKVHSRTRRGTYIHFHLSRRARVRIAIVRLFDGRKSGGRCVKPTQRLRKHPVCRRHKAKGSLRYSGKRGRNLIPFRGRVAGHRLKRGRFRATIVATTGKHRRSRPVRAMFTIA